MLYFTQTVAAELSVQFYFMMLLVMKYNQTQQEQMLHLKTVYGSPRGLILLMLLPVSLLYN